MVTIPLGLGTRWPKKPVVTLALAVILTLFFLFEHGQTRSMNKTLLTLSSPQYRLAKEALFLEYCRARDKAEVCGEILPSIAPDYLKDEREHRSPRPQPKKSAPSKPNNQSDTPKLDLKTSLAKQRRMQKLFAKFEIEVSTPSKAFQKLRAYPAFAGEQRKLQKQTRATAKVEHVLTKDNLSFTSIFFGQIRHGGWSHLFGNLLCLIPFGIYVELRMGALRYVLAYTIAGTAGLAINALFFLPPDLPLLGASANIAGVMGLFYVLFFQARMQFFLWFGLSRRLWVPVKFALPVVYFIADVTGAVQSLVPGMNGGGVAHFAHLAGLITGLVIGWIFLKIEPLPAPFIYRSELSQFKALQSLERLDYKIHAAGQALLVNPCNSLVRALTLESILRQPAALLTSKQNQAHAFLFANLDRHCSTCVQEGNYAHAYRMLGAIPLPISLALYLRTLGQTEHLLIAEFAVAERNHYLALRLYDAFLQRWSSTRKGESIRHSVLEILRNLPDTTQVGTALQTYRTAVSHTVLTKEFDLKLSWIQGQIDRMNVSEDENEANRAG